jgi:hypothetical protein
VCDACIDAGRPFLACSLACLTAHVAEEHPGAGDSAARVAAYQRRVNRNVAGNRDWYASHRARVAALLTGAGPGGDLCVLGAGNGSDLDLPALAARFRQIDLVDLDGEALERCREGAPSELRDRLVLHPDVDLSGFAARLDEWGEAFPSDAELGRAAQPAIHGILRQLGGPFDVVASTCALSQLAVPYHRAWILPAAGWASLNAAVTAVHLATLAGATRSGGASLLVFDVLSSRVAPGLRELEGATPEVLASFVDEQTREGGRLDPVPDVLLARLGALGRLVSEPHLTAPWLWNIGAETQLVYGLAFTRS